MFLDESNDQGATARDEIISPLDDDRGTDAGDGAFEALLVAFDEGLASGSTASIPDLTSVPPDLTAELRGVQDCLSLLHAASRAGQLDDLAHNGSPRRPDAPPTLEAMDRIGRFEIVRELGRGGYGIVFLALDPDLGRRVALKVPRPEALVTPELRRRFLREAEAAGSLQHPNLVTVYEAGEDGPLCYLVTAYCDGPTLAQWLKIHNDPVAPREAAQLVAAIADGVEHAHCGGVLHRDVKPSNVLLEPLALVRTIDDSAPPLLSAFTPKLTDFGLAKLLERPDDETRTGTLLGTPAYMAPEQAAGRMREICAATDVYGLGVVLYEVLTGRPPLRGENDPDTLRQICVDEPMPPSRLRPGLPRDLQAICLKCLEKKPAKRYESAAELAHDLRRFLAGEPTLARPATRWQRVLKWSRRRPATAALVGVIVAAAVSLASVVGVYTIRLGTALTDAERGQAEANRQRQAAQESQHGADASRAETRRLLYSADVKLAGEDYRNGNPGDALTRLQQHLPVAGEDDLREYAWHYLWHRCHQRQLTLRGHTAGVLWSSYSHSGSLVATASRDGSIRLWQTSTGQGVRVLNGHEGDVNCISFSPDDRWLASAGMDATVRIWDVATGQQVQLIAGHNDEVFAVQFSPSGRQLASGGRDRRVQLWDTTEWRLRGTLAGHQDFVESLAFAPDEKTLASGGADSVVHLWDLEQLKSRAALQGRCRSIYSICFSPSGGLLAAATQDGQILWWDLANLSEVRRTQASETHVTSVAFAPDGRRLLSASRDGSARLWDLASGRLEAVFNGHAERLWHAEFSPDGTQIVTASSDQTAKLCKLSEPFEPRPESDIDRGEVGFGPNGDFRAVSRDGIDALGLAIHHDGLRETWRPAFATIVCCNLDPVGPHAVARDTTGRLYFWTSQGSCQLVPGQFAGYQSRAPTLSPGGSLLADGFHELQVVETTHWNSVLKAPLSAPLAWKTFSRNGSRLAAGLLDGTFMIWDLSSPGEPRSWKPFSMSFNTIGSFSYDDSLLAMAGDDGHVRVLDTSTGRIRYDLSAHRGRVLALAFSHDGANLATAGEDRQVRVWDLRTARDLLTFTAEGSSLAFAPDGSELVGSPQDGPVLRWTSPREGHTPHRMSPVEVSILPATDEHRERHVTDMPVWAIPRGEPLLSQALPAVFDRFSQLGSRRGAVVRPTFDDRESNDGLQLGALVIKGVQDSGIRYTQSAGIDDIRQLACDADTFAIDKFKSGGYPSFANGYTTFMVLLEPGTFERRDVGQDEIEELDSDRDRFREIHRWAKRHGFAGGFPTFVDSHDDGEPVYGTILIKPEFGEEIFLPAATVWQADALSRPRP